MRRVFWTLLVYFKPTFLLFDAFGFTCATLSPLLKLGSSYSMLAACTCEIFGILLVLIFQVLLSQNV